MFKVMQVLEIIETKLQNNSNGSEKDYYIKLREELEQKLHDFLKDKEDLCSEKTNHKK